MQAASCWTPKQLAVSTLQKRDYAQQQQQHQLPPSQAAPTGGVLTSAKPAGGAGLLRSTGSPGSPAGYRRSGKQGPSHKSAAAPHELGPCCAATCSWCAVVTYTTACKHMTRPTACCACPSQQRPSCVWRLAHLANQTAAITVAAVDGQPKSPAAGRAVLVRADCLCRQQPAKPPLTAAA